MTTEMPAPTSSDQPRPERVLRASRPGFLTPSANCTRPTSTGVE